METNMFDISGKVAVVTGASGVLGGSIAESLMTAVLAAIVEYKNQQVRIISANFIPVYAKIIFPFNKILRYFCDLSLNKIN